MRYYNYERFDTKTFSSVPEESLLKRSGLSKVKIGNQNHKRVVPSSLFSHYFDKYPQKKTFSSYRFLNIIMETLTKLKKFDGVLRMTRTTKHKGDDKKRMSKKLCRKKVSW